MASDNPATAPRTRRVGELVGAVLDTVLAKRGMASAALIADWPAIVGERYAGWTQPKRIVWPQKSAGGGATLELHVDGPRAVYLQHEIDQILERINRHMGSGAITRIRIIQAPVPRREIKVAKADPALSPGAAALLDQQLSGIDDTGLRGALRRLGAAVLNDTGTGIGEETP